MLSHLHIPHSSSLSTQFLQEREKEPEEKMPQTLLREERASNVFQADHK